MNNNGSTNVWVIRQPQHGEAPDRYCGVIYVTVDSPVGGHMVGDLNYFVHPDCRRKNVGLNAAKLVVDHMFRASRIPPLTSICAKVRKVDSAASGGILEKLGFHKKKFELPVTASGERGHYWCLERN